MTIEHISRHCQVPLGGKTKLVKNQCHRLAFPPSQPHRLQTARLSLLTLHPTVSHGAHPGTWQVLEDLALTLLLCEGPGNTWELVPWEEPRFQVWIKFWGLGLNESLTT